MRRYAGLMVALALVGGLALASGTGGPQTQLTGDEQIRVLMSLPEVSTLSIDRTGTPDFVAGRLGTLGRGSVEGSGLRFVRRMSPLYNSESNEDLASARTLRDEIGQVHIKFEQHYNGLRIERAGIWVHATQDTGEVHAIVGRLYSTTDVPTVAGMGPEMAVTEAAVQAGIGEGKVLDYPALTYVVADSKVYLAYRTRIQYEADGMQLLDRIYADANTGDLVTSEPLIKTALSRKVYNANHTENLPGTLMFQEGGSSTDVDAQTVYNHAGTTYNYFKTKFNRDSYNGSGATMISSVHLGNNYVNAYWTGSQTAFGDGDGSQASSLARDLDVVAHEWTHAVTDYSADLAYQSESGALNEAMSDIFGVSVSAYKDGAISANTWKVGELCWTPATSGDALRYMNNPTQDGSSKDYYPERMYAGTCTPSSSNDYCGVHYNSGIGNLAYYLVVAGGTHPRGKTTVSVPAIGMAKAEQIFYRALTYGYMTSNTNFQGARNATAQAATDLYTATEVAAIQKCWDAVGAPGGTVAVTTLTNGQTVSSLSGATGSWAYYKIVVPASQTQLVIKTFNGTGDCDLYVKKGATPTSTVYDYRPYLSGNTETVTVTNPAAAEWYIGLYGYAAFSGMSLQATYSGTTPTPDFTMSLSPTSLSVAQGASGTVTVTTAVSGGFNSAVALTATGVPTGASKTFSPTSIAAPGSGTSTLTLGAGTAAAGTYTVTVTGTGGGKTKTATVAFTVTTSGGSTETEPNNTTAQANVISTTGKQLTGYISTSTDVDYFKVSLPAGKTLTVEMWPPSTKDYDVKLYSSTGTLLASGTNAAGVKETVTYKNTGTSAKVIYIKNYGYNSAYSASLTYTIKFTW